MKKSWVLMLVGICALCLPVIARSLWFYQGVVERKDIQTPDYASLTVPLLATSTPPTASVPPEATSAVILFDLTHANWFTPAEIAPLIENLQRTSAQVKWSGYEEDLSSELSEATTYFIINPTAAFYDYELEAIGAFVQQGGKLIVITDPTRDEFYSSDYYSTTLSAVDVANQVLLPYGISFNNDYAYNLTDNEGNFRNVFALPAGQNPLLDQVSRLVLYSAHSINSDGVALLTTSPATLSSLTDTGEGLVFATLDQDESVMAIGDFTFLTSAGFTAADNQVFLSNLVAYALEDQKTFRVDQFPDMIQGELAVYLSDGMDKDADLISSISNLQSSSLGGSRPVRFVDSLEPSADLLVLGLIPPSEDILTLVEPYKIDFYASDPPVYSEEATPSQTGTTTPELTETPAEAEWSDAGYWPESEDTLSIPGFGDVSKSGVGLILYTHAAGQDIFILLGNSQAGVIQLLDNLIYASMSSCLTLNDISVCQVYEDMDY